MATTQIPYSNLVPNGNLTQPAGTTLVAAPTDNMRISDAFLELTVLRVTNTSAVTPFDFTVKAGDSPPALAAGQGDLVVTMAVSSAQYLGPFESGRFVQSDGSVFLEATAVTGAVTAFRVPRNT